MAEPSKTPVMFDLLSLPPELFEIVVGYLGPKEHSYLMRSGNHSLYNILIPTRNKLAMQDKGGVPALIWGVMIGYPALVKLVLEIMSKQGDDINIRCRPGGDTAIHYAIIQGNISMIRLLLAKGIDVELETRREEAALQLAVGLWYDAWVKKTAYEEIIRLLLMHGASTSHPTGTWHVPALHMVVKDQSERITRLLLQHGADPSVKEYSTGFTPLHIAATNNLEHSTIIAQILLEAGSDVNARSHRGGNTPLHYAVLVDNIEICGLLLEYGADMEATNDDGRTPVSHAYYVRNTNIG